MKTKIKEAFAKYILNNLRWKVFAVVLAAVVWVVVINFVDPITFETARIPVELVNIDALHANERILINERDLANLYVDVTVRGNMSQINNLDNRLTATIDLSIPAIAENPVRADVSVTALVELHNSGNYDFVITNQSHSAVDVFVEEIITVARDVTLYPRGALAHRRTAISAAAAPSQVTVRGPRSQVEAIEFVYAVFDQAGMDRTFERRGTGLTAVNFAGSSIHGLSFYPPMVDVAVDVLMEGTVRLVLPEHIGTPGTDFAVSGVNSDNKPFTADFFRHCFKEGNVYAKHAGVAKNA